MSINTAHANNGVLIYSGECILLFCDNIKMEFSGQDRHEFKGSKSGRLYLTTHRMIFNNTDPKDPMASFSFPFSTLKEVELEQPMFGANYIRGKVRAQPDGGFIGEAKFKLHFKHGGAIEYGQAMLQAANMGSANRLNFKILGVYNRRFSPPYADTPPPYQAPPNYGALNIQKLIIIVGRIAPAGPPHVSHNPPLRLVIILPGPGLTSGSDCFRQFFHIDKVAVLLNKLGALIMTMRLIRRNKRRITHIYNAYFLKRYNIKLYRN
nr:EOG090X0ADZ [Ilyocryptus agilis]